VLLWLAKRRPCSAAGVHLPTSFIRDVCFGVAAAAKLQHIQLLCCLKMSQSKVMYSHVISSILNISKCEILQPTKAPLKRAWTYPSRGPLQFPQKGLYIPFKRTSTYSLKRSVITPQRAFYIPLKKAYTIPTGHLQTPQKGLYTPHQKGLCIPVACSSRLVMRCLRAMPSLPFALYALCCRRAAALPAGWPAIRASRVAPCTAGDTYKSAMIACRQIAWKTVRVD